MEFGGICGLVCDCHEKLPVQNTSREEIRVRFRYFMQDGGAEKAGMKVGDGFGHITDWVTAEIEAGSERVLAFIESQKKELEMQSDGEYHFVNNAKVASHNHALELVETFINDTEHKS